jgi:hypothetical protein
VLERRYGPGVNSFWLTHDSQTHPTMSLLVNGELSTLLYVPKEGHPGYTPLGNVEGLNLERFTAFSIDTVDRELEVWNEQVVSISAALSAAKDFFLSPELPKSIDWAEL